VKASTRLDWTRLDSDAADVDGGVRGGDDDDDDDDRARARRERRWVWWSWWV